MSDATDSLPQVQLTPRAAQVFREACEAEQKPLEGSFMRIGARPGGCSGWKYELEWNGSPDVKDTDVVVSSEGVNLVVDRECLLEVLGPIRIDFSDRNLVEQGFIFQQLVNGHQCGCGESFTPVRDLQPQVA